MTFVEELKSLAKLPPSPHPFLTLYLNTRWNSEKQRERVRIFVKTKLRESVAAYESTNGEGRQSLEKDVESIEQYVKGLVNREWDEGYGGIALFTCAGLGTHALLRSHLPFEEALHCADRPALRPAAEQVHAGSAAVLCFVGGSSGRLLEFELGGLLREFRFRDEAFPGRHEQGGWSQSRYQRHVDEHLGRNFRAIADQLVKWVDEKGAKRVLLSGTEADLSAFEQHLPQRVAQLISARLRIDPNANMGAIQEQVEGVLSRARTVEDSQAVDALLEKGLGPGRAVSGSAAVAQAAAAGKVHTLYLDKGFRESGGTCPSCNLLGVNPSLACPSCGSPVDAVELGEELVRRTLAADGVVLVVGEHAGLRARGGVAAMVRYG